MSDYVSRHRDEWEELARLVEKASGKFCFRRMSAEELNRLDVLYRRASVQLAQVATRTDDAVLIRYLNDLVASAHAVIYVSPKSGWGADAAEFAMTGFSRATARTLRFQMVSLGLLVFGLLLGYSASARDPSAAYALLPAGDPRQPGARRDQLMEIIRSGRDLGGGGKFLFASFLFNHNLKVGLLAMCTGVLAMAPSALLILYNGMMLGAFTHVHHAAGVYVPYWAWILPHGVTELGAVVLFGGAGLRLGWAVVSPGRLTRKESLTRGGREAARIVLGAGGMLVFAAVIESFLRQSRLSDTSRLVFAAGTALFWGVYFLQGVAAERRERERESGEVTPDSARAARDSG